MNFRLYDNNHKITDITEPTAVTVGVFDGVHRGHRFLLGKLSENGLAPLVVSLCTHPSFVLGRRKQEQWLDDAEEHRKALFDAGVRYVAELDFTKETAIMTACGMARMIFEQLNMRSLLIGYDSRFGNKTHDDFDKLPSLAKEAGFELKHCEPYLYKGTPISSSRIRKALETGNMEIVADLMGRPYTISGTVTHGRNVGHTLGFPTANIDFSQSRKTLPKEGVYAVRLKVENTECQKDIKEFNGMANLGPQPTFGQRKAALEVYIIDFEGDIYNKQVEVEFVGYLRDIIHFDSTEALQKQLSNDLKQCIKL